MCEITAGIQRSNCANKGGIKSIVLINDENVAFTVADKVATIGTQTKTAYEIQLDLNSGFANSVATGARDNNSSYYEETIMAMVKRDDIDTAKVIDVLASGYFKAVVRYRNGNNRVFGVNNGLFLTTIDGNSGQAFGDMNGWTVNLAGQEELAPPTISNTDVDTLLAFTS